MGTFLEHFQEHKQLGEAFNSEPYELTMGKKGAGDIFFTFVDEEDQEYRIQFYTPQGLGKRVRQVFIGQKRGTTYPDAISRFKNPARVIASMVEATNQFLKTPVGMGVEGLAVNFSKKALERGLKLIPKVIRQSNLKQKLSVLDLTYTPDPSRGYVWLVRKGVDPSVAFDGPKMQGITWGVQDQEDLEPNSFEKRWAEKMISLARRFTSSPKYFNNIVQALEDPEMVYRAIEYLQLNQDGFDPNEYSSEEEFEFRMADLAIDEIKNGWTSSANPNPYQRK